ncbi:sigma-54 interaction domain-containing protein [Desulfovibrio litoralis]|uniref:Transcriptional regulator containing PAS, AAA-type ATPase, and DNA-binding Fis domains n=1 Tax=Desulfovibrio litoralis DSM 11393 TaxID=1121455 RepID=A0A1M7S9C1_9BACT|nr:sigma 54-interacting transcriptional regulator [Desulfovibrio litoralis]SHN55040.1 Transcriptional regulator containing PAS, AAA-type ATPase, and DNA-binding Fis domains [Desulfovibrio litoralis DSM 11393]
MLSSISAYVERYTKLINTVTNINVEVADINLVRIAGTGMYAQGVGQSIKQEGQVYRHVLKNKEAIIMLNPRENEICLGCSNRKNCKETLSLSTPIKHNNKVLGVISIICFTQEERERILEKIEVYKAFVEQMANAVSFAVTEKQHTKQTEHLLDTFLKITDTDNRGILTTNTQGMITYLNNTAKKSLNITEQTQLKDITIKKTGVTLSGMEEFEINVDGRILVMLGHLSQLNSEDDTFNSALVFDSLPAYRKQLSQIVFNKETSNLDSIIGESRKILELKQRVINIAPTLSTVLITGESGTGKEMFARAIHAESDRSDKPFVAINCGAIPDNLLESELFGYVGGAFTGASVSGHMGKFEMAHQGVLFLDEIGAMPIYLQVKLLRFLQDRTITRLGSNRIIKIDVRIIAATNDLLQELISQRMFREDLYYRLNVIPLKIPPLRERIEDISALANFFLEKYCILFSKKLVRPTLRMLDVLQKYTWPGNVREFENIMEYLVNIIPNGGSATVSMLPTKILNAVALSENNKNVQNNMPTQSTKDSETEKIQQETILPLVELEKNAIQNALKKYKDSPDSKILAAQALGIGIATLYRKIKSYNLE